MLTLVGRASEGYQAHVNDDWSYCQRALELHSRTFAIPISFLPGELRQVVTCAYLLCRVADTIEDTAAWSPQTKESLYRSFLDLLTDDKKLSAWRESVEVAADAPFDPTKRGELDLMLDIGRIFKVLDASANELQREVRNWVGELTRGMSIYTHRGPGLDGITCLHSPADLERYCYFVAGTIGRLLTATFLAHLPEIKPADRIVLSAQAERFGAGLQLVNILRDITEDIERDCSFIPRTLLAEHGLSPKQLVDPAQEAPVRKALQPLFELAEEYLDSALDYALALPQTASQIRMFVLIPLWLAVATLQECRTSADLLKGGSRVKLSRERVSQLVQDCMRLASSHQDVRVAFTKLRSPHPR